MATKKRPLPIRAIDTRVLLGDLAVDAQHTWLTGFAFDDTPRLVAVAHGASEPHLVVRARSAPPLSHVVSDGALVIASAEQRLVRIDPATGALTTLATTPAAMTTALALDGDWIYGTVTGAEGGVYRVPRAGGALAWIRRGWSLSLAASRGRVACGDGANVWLSPSPTAPLRPLTDVANAHAIAFADDTLVWCEFTPEGWLHAIDLTTGQRRALTAAPYGSSLVALDGYLYWAQASSRKTRAWIWRMRLDDPASVEPLVLGGCKRGRLAGHGTTLAWCGSNDGGAFTLDLAALAPRG